MAKHTEPPESGADSAADHSVDHPADIPLRDSGQDFSEDFNPEVDPASASPPARFGRLALWAASTSALTVGVAATVAYGVWFDQDQRTYAKAVAVAQQTLSAGAAVSPEQQTLSASAAASPEQQSPSLGTATAPAQQRAWSGRVAVATPPPEPPAVLAEAASANPDPATPATPAQPESTGVAAHNSVAPQAGTGQSAKVSCSVKQDRHRPAPRAKPNHSLFARVQSFFHRVSYRQHGNGSQRDIYTHS